jgi:hypothetical protein
MKVISPFLDHQTCTMETCSSNASIPVTQSPNSVPLYDVEI